MSRTPRLVYEGEHLRALAMPLGGIGCGSVAICGDGGLRQWQILNNICHHAHVPHSFFAVRAQTGAAEPVARVLMSAAHYDDKFEPAPGVSDHVVPAASRQLLAALPGVARIRFVGEYPVAEVHYEDDALPVAVILEAFSPFVPLDVEGSGLPAIAFASASRTGRIPSRGVPPHEPAERRGLGRLHGGPGSPSSGLRRQPEPALPLGRPARHRDDERDPAFGPSPLGPDGGRRPGPGRPRAHSLDRLASPLARLPGEGRPHARPLDSQRPGRTSTAPSARGSRSPRARHATPPSC
jgi:hypothetical protein